uniref:Uncharacterized protein n=1 Tax=Setaria digitata TaxID=48799 RepID=A0A915PZC9_9BILA
MIFGKDRQSAQLLKCPIIPSRKSYEIISDGPISIWYYGERKNQTDRYAFQIIREVVPMLFITFNHQTSIIAQSSTPIYIPSDMNIIVDGENVQLYVSEDCQITKRDDKSKHTLISRERFEIPKSRIIVLHCADVQRQFRDVVQVIITEGMVAYCGGKNRITLNVYDTRIIILQE